MIQDAPSTNQRECEARIFIKYTRLKSWRQQPEYYSKLPQLEDEMDALLEEHHERWPEHVAAG